MSPISVRGLAVASATAVTTVGAVVGVASGAQKAGPSEPVEAAGTTTLLADIPEGQQVQQASLTEQVLAQSDAADATARQSAEQAARVQAAKDAAAKKKAADDAAAEAAKRKQQEEQAGSGDAGASFPTQSSYTVAEVKAMAQQIVGSGQFACFSNIVTRESGWNYLAVNPSSGAYGLVQANPGSKMASVASDWRTNPATQIKWGLNYMNSRYGSPCGAWDYWQAHSSY
ncbi:transglycosylase SLT domain-containing protein [Actinacidiphila sp. DG2A-62]|uniref:aggregation-promoting factor C-terminal-like domain-containing protein n=1 Tax=Actinacidiphila sp. DG2A-62 TaxID=3108821 RepID=UPI002DBBAEF9|nr:transglycosylase SLT domain-containing protein [Actinacidiphila sp. DG2A-62]MEC3996712.1 transglycosylase SLT domain-containing protein [Actinacidiphila sp. DG2A-62]